MQVVPDDDERVAKQGRRGTFTELVPHLLVAEVPLPKQVSVGLGRHAFPKSGARVPIDSHHHELVNTSRRLPAPRLMLRCTRHPDRDRRRDEDPIVPHDRHHGYDCGQPHATNHNTPLLCQRIGRRDPHDAVAVDVGSAHATGAMRATGIVSSCPPPQGFRPGVTEVETRTMCCRGPAAGSRV